MQVEAEVNKFKWRGPHESKGRDVPKRLGGSEERHREGTQCTSGMGKSAAGTEGHVNITVHGAKQEQVKEASVSVNASRNGLSKECLLNWVSPRGSAGACVMKRKSKRRKREARQRGRVENKSESDEG